MSGQSPSTLLWTPGAGEPKHPADGVWAPEKRQGGGLGSQAGPLSPRVVALSWVTTHKELVKPLSRDMAPNRDTTLEPGWLDREGWRARPLGPPTGHSVLKGSHKVEQPPLLIPEGSRHSRNLSPSEVTPLSLQAWATTHLVSIRISLLRVSPINGIP